MPVYNGEKWLEQSIDSVIKQTYRNVEILLINDGSTDSSGKILQKFAHYDDRIRVLEKSNSGLVNTLNLGLHLATGRWVARIDQDDYWSHTKLAEQLTVVSQNAEIVLVGTSFNLLIEGSEIRRVVNVPTRHRSLVRRLETMRGFFPHSSAVFRRDVALAIGGYDPNAILNEDWDLWLRLSEFGKLRCVACPLVTIRKHHSQMTAQNNKRLVLEESLVSTTVHFIRKARSIHGPITLPDDLRLQLRTIIANDLCADRELNLISLQRGDIKKIFKPRNILKFRNQIDGRFNLNRFRVIRFMILGSNYPALRARNFLEDV
jgi:glycosyltransferase involved in cell wall biosynthesis